MGDVTRQINVWMYHAEFGTICHEASLATGKGKSYPRGNTQGQAGWDVAEKFTTFEELARKLHRLDVPGSKHLERGEISRLAVLAHGNLDGVVYINGSNEKSVLTAQTVANYRETIKTIDVYTKYGATVLFMGCLAGLGDGGTNLLLEISKIAPSWQIIGFNTLGYRHSGEMYRGGERCEEPGTRDTGQVTANMALFDKQWIDLAAMPWASENSPNAKIAKNRKIVKWPKGEAASTASPVRPR